MSHDDGAIVLDLVRAARLVVEFRGDLDKPAFLTDLKTQSAILHQLLIFGDVPADQLPAVRDDWRGAGVDAET